MAPLIAGAVLALQAVPALALPPIGHFGGGPGVAHFGAAPAHVGGGHIGGGPIGGGHIGGGPIGGGHIGGGPIHFGGGGGFGLHPHFDPRFEGAHLNEGWHDKWDHDWNWYVNEGLVWNAEANAYYYLDRPCFYSDDGYWYYSDCGDGPYQKVPFAY